MWGLFFLIARSLLTLLPGQWDGRQSCKYTLGATFVIISQNFLITCHNSFGHVIIARHNIKHVLWHAIATHVAFYSQPGLDFNLFSWLFVSLILAFSLCNIFYKILTLPYENFSLGSLIFSKIVETWFVDHQHFQQLHFYPTNSIC